MLHKKCVSFSSCIFSTSQMKKKSSCRKLIINSSNIFYLFKVSQRKKNPNPLAYSKPRFDMLRKGIIKNRII